MVRAPRDGLRVRLRDGQGEAVCGGWQCSKADLGCEGGGIRSCAQEPRGVGWSWCRERRMGWAWGDLQLGP